MQKYLLLLLGLVSFSLCTQQLPFATQWRVAQLEIVKQRLEEAKRKQELEQAYQNVEQAIQWIEVNVIPLVASVALSYASNKIATTITDPSSIVHENVPVHTRTAVRVSLEAISRLLVNWYAGQSATQNVKNSVWQTTSFAAYTYGIPLVCTMACKNIVEHPGANSALWAYGFTFPFSLDDKKLNNEVQNAVCYVQLYKAAGLPGVGGYFMYDYFYKRR